MKIKEILELKDAGEFISKCTFEDGLKILEELVQSVESGTLPLDKAVSSYEVGAKLVNHLRALLSGAEEKLKVLGGSNV